VLSNIAIFYRTMRTLCAFKDIPEKRSL